MQLSRYPPVWWLIFFFRLVDCYASYFGAFTCVSWSPDGRFILVSALRSAFLMYLMTIAAQTGGQDDLVTIFSPWEQRVIARCQGHSSFVAGVAFDEIRCDGRTYRFGSIGEDNKFILVRVSWRGSRMTAKISLVGLFKWRVAQAEITCELSSKNNFSERDTHCRIRRLHISSACL